MGKLYSKYIVETDAPLWETFLGMVFLKKEKNKYFEKIFSEYFQNIILSHVVAWLDCVAMLDHDVILAHTAMRFYHSSLVKLDNKFILFCLVQEDNKPAKFTLEITELE